MYAAAQQLFAKGVTPKAVTKLHELARAQVDPHGRATPRLQRALERIDADFGGAMEANRKTLQRFQGILGSVGVRTHRRLEIPIERRPYWLMGPQPLANFQSAPKLPEEADVVIVGAGLTGGSTAYHFVELMKQHGLSVVVLDGGDPGNAASGRNGGNFELLPENFFGKYEGIEKERFDYLEHLHPEVDPAILKVQANREARALLELTATNRRRFEEIVRHEKLEDAIDFAPHGWVRAAASAVEEQGLKDEVAFMQSLGLPAEVWSKERIKKELGVDAEFDGRFTPDGNYHPFKFVTALLQKAIAGGVQLFTRTKVDAIDSEAQGRHLVRTPRGTIRAKKVILATNAYTRELVPELAGIQPWRSQIQVTAHAPVKFQQYFSTKQGDLYCHFRDDDRRYYDPELARATGGRMTHRAPFIQGGGLDRPTETMNPPVSRKTHGIMQVDRDFVLPEIKGQPPVQMWSGLMDFTRDRKPVIGEVRPGVIVGAGLNGYGGCYCVALGQVLSEHAVTGKAPALAPQDVFAPQRLLTSEPYFLNAKPEGLA